MLLTFSILLQIHMVPVDSINAKINKQTRPWVFEMQLSENCSEMPNCISAMIYKHSSANCRENNRNSNKLYSAFHNTNEPKIFFGHPLDAKMLFMFRDLNTKYSVEAWSNKGSGDHFAPIFLFYYFTEKSTYHRMCLI